ncbi:MAG: DUF4091 domain-containing protein [Ruminococcaceae bacterium]|nr:DUF4091 domain-containing protein [Oscillospiraceae bacterium]
MKKNTRFLACLLAVIMISGATSCTGGGKDDPTVTGGETVTNTGGYGDISDADIWSAPATEKVYQDISEGYDDFRGEAAISLTVARGEYEAQQIIISAKDKDLEYEVRVKDLTSGDGLTFSAENIEIFHEKYLEVTDNWEENGMPLAWYPDALVPVENIKAAGENVVNAGDNQGLYVRFNVPVGQTAGVYSGAFILTVNGQEKEIPITLTVLDVTVSEVTHMQSHFGVGYQYFRGELDHSQAMYEKYCEKLMEYRLSRGIVMEKVTTNPEDVQYYVDTAYKWITEHGCTTISIPYGSSYMEINGSTYRTIDKETFSLYLKAFAQKSFETGHNMFDQLITRTGSLIDEPQGLADGEARVRAVAETWKEVKLQVAREIEDDESITSPIKAEVVQGIRDLIDVVTAAYHPVYDGYVETFCPQFTAYDTEEGRALYANQERKWFYGCIHPRAPYPTYKIDDTLISARAVGWMQAEYDVSGNLYWSTTLYQTGSESGYYDIEDYYGQAERYSKANGDGSLFYPGKRYGIDGPVVSMRLEAIRDGIEEYELLYELEALYEEKIASLNVAGAGIEMDFKRVIAGLTASIYEGTRVSTDSQAFRAARDTLLRLCLMQAKADAYLIDFVNDGYGNVSFQFLVPGGKTLEVGGKPLSASARVTDADGVKYDVYVFSQVLDQNKNYLSVEVQNGEDTYGFDWYLGGKVFVMDALSMDQSEFSAEGVAPTYELITDGASIDATIQGPLVKLALGKTDPGTSQSIRLGGTVAEKVAFRTTVQLRIYYEGKDLPDFTISVKFSNMADLVEVASLELQQGMNKITVRMPTSEWAENASAEYFVICVKRGERERARDLYLKDVILYTK